MRDFTTVQTPEDLKDALEGARILSCESDGNTVVLGLESIAGERFDLVAGATQTVRVDGKSVTSSAVLSVQLRNSKDSE